MNQVSLLNRLAGATYTDLESTLVLLLVKITILLASAWIVQAWLHAQNPGWRRLLWRVTAGGMILVTGLAISPPLLNWKVLPAEVASLEPQESSPAARHVGDVVVAATLPLDSHSSTEHFAHQPGLLTRGSHEMQRHSTGNATIALARGLRGGSGAVSSTIPDGNSEADSAPVSLVTARPILRISTVLLCVWLGGVCALAIRTLLGLVALNRIRQRGSPVSECLNRQTRQIADDLGLPQNPAVRQSDEIEAPCLIGLLRPIVWLPSDVVRNPGNANLTSIVAHECAHLVRRDLQWNALWQLLSILFWFHPLSWRARTAHADACDSVVDAMAADYVKDADGYCRTLAVLALRAAHPVPAAGLGMARRSAVWRRIEMLKRGVSAIGLPLGQRWAAVTISLIGLILLGGVTVSRIVAAPEQSVPALNSSLPQEPGGQSEGNQELRGSLPVLFHDAESGEPIPDVAVDFHGWIGAARVNQQRNSDEAGRCELTWDGDPRIRNLWFTARKPGYVPVHRDWRGDRKEIELPEQVDVEFVKSSMLQGVVKDELGNPIENAAVRITLTPLQSEMSNYVFNAATTETDKDGKWSWDGAPADAQRIGVRIEHPSYISGFSRVNSVEVETVATLRQGLIITGRVTDGGGSPVAGATVRFATDMWGTDSPTTQTNDEGQFELVNCQPGNSAVTVQAKGFAPQLQETVAAATSEPLEFALEPGNTMHLKVVDPEGVPVIGAHLAADTWLGYRTIAMRANADAKGEFIWRDAPSESVKFHVLKQGFVANRNVIVFPNDAAQIVTLYPELTIAGTVKSSETKDLVDQFQVVRGYKSENDTVIRWSEDRPVEYGNGQFRYTFDEPRQELYLKVMADGFEPEVSRAFRSDEGVVEFDFSLDKGWSIRGHVRRADGSTVENAKVAYLTSEKMVMLKNGVIDSRQGNAVTTQTDRTGRFKFSPTGKADEPFLLLAVCDDGQAVFRSLPGKPKDGKPSAAVTLPFDPKKILKLEIQPWGRIEGTVYTGGKPAARQLMNFNSTALHEQVHPFRLWSSNVATSNDEGKFVFENVPLGIGSVAKVVVRSNNNWTESTYCWQTSVDVSAGETTSTAVAENGVVIKGSVATDRKTERSIDWENQAKLSIRRLNAETERPESGTEMFIALGAMDRDGEFEILDIPVGTYDLTVKLSHDANAGFSGINQEIGAATVPVVIKSNQTDPVNLGQLIVKLHATLDPGEIAPDFFAEDVWQPGESFRLRDFHGKLVLLNFWNRPGAESVALMKTMKRMRKRFSVSKFQVISVFVGNSRQSPEDQIQAGDFQWRQGRIHGLWAQTADDYSIKQLPATFLIGPDGTLIAKNLDEAALLAAISDSLVDKKSFENVGPPRPRFSLTKTGVVESTLAVDEQDPPSVLVTTGIPDFQLGQVREGAVRFLTRAGKEVWSLPMALRTWDSANSIMAVDASRNRIYLRQTRINPEDKGGTSAYDLTGQRLWTVDCEGPMAIDRKTGNVWVSSGRSLNHGTLTVFDPNGQEVAAWPIRAIGMGYDSFSDSMWIVGYEIIKMNRDGKVLFRRKVQGWSCNEVKVESDGTVHVAERSHPDVAQSRNQILVLSNAGKLTKTIPLSSSPRSIAIDPTTGKYWVGSGEAGTESGESQMVRRYHASEGRDGIWVVNETGLNRIDSEGHVMLNVVPLGEFDYLNVQSIR